MSKKLFILVIVIFIAILGVLGWRLLLAPAAAPTSAVPASSDTNLFPFGQGATKPSGAQPVKPAPSTNAIDISGSTNVARLRKLSLDPTAGGAFVSTATTTTAIRFVDKATGHIIESSLDSVAQTKLSNITIPQVREVLWGDKASTLVYRYLKSPSTIQSFYAAIKPGAASSSQPIEGLFLPTDIGSIAVSGGKVLYFDPTVENGRLIQANIDGSKKVNVWGSEFGEWGISSTNPAKAFVYTKPSGSARGIGYIIDTVGGGATKVIGDVAGLEGSISPTSDYIFLSAGENGGIASASYSVAKKAVTQLTVNTLASKCAWGNKDKKSIYCGVPAGIPTGTYPDDWYKGTVSFTDRLWKINMETFETTVILDPFLDANSNFDMTNLVVDPTDTYISFVNKSDLTIWLYKIK